MNVASLHLLLPAAHRRPHREIPRYRPGDRAIGLQDVSDGVMNGMRAVSHCRSLQKGADLPTPSASWQTRFLCSEISRGLTRRQPGSEPSAIMLQIYFDFSGYSDMAIGLGRDVRLPLSRRTLIIPIFPEASGNSGADGICPSRAGSRNTSTFRWAATGRAKCGRLSTNLSSSSAPVSGTEPT